MLTLVLKESSSVSVARQERKSGSQRKATGRPPKLDCKRHGKAILNLVEHPATEYGYEHPLWTCQRIRQVIGAEGAASVPIDRRGQMGYRTEAQIYANVCHGSFNRTAFQTGCRMMYFGNGREGACLRRAVAQIGTRLFCRSDWGRLSEYLQPNTAQNIITSTTAADRLAHPHGLLGRSATWRRKRHRRQ
jgi:hypothetical protein